MQEIRSSNLLAVTGIRDPNKSWAQHYRKFVVKVLYERLFQIYLRFLKRNDKLLNIYGQLLKNLFR